MRGGLMVARVTWGFLSFLGGVSYRIRILMYMYCDVSCMYPVRILTCPVHVHQDTSRYIRIHYVGPVTRSRGSGRREGARYGARQKERPQLALRIARARAGTPVGRRQQEPHPFLNLQKRVVLNRTLLCNYSARAAPVLGGTSSV